MLEKIIGAIVAGLIGLVLIAIVALIGTLFLYAGWNWGVVPAMPNLAHSVDLAQAFWLSLGLSSIGSRFKSDKLKIDRD